MSNNKTKYITSQTENHSKWYLDVINHSEIATYALVSGTFFIKPYGTKIWELVQSELNEKFSKKGIENVIFPSLIPYSEFEKEKDHIDNFSLELFIINDENNNKIALRPTSEILFGHYFANELQSINQLPIKLNQWANVFRNEMKNVFFLRSSEFNWQEGHTIHSSENEAKDFVHEMLNLYKIFFEEFLAIPVLTGNKTESEKFAGAVETLTIEAFAKNGKAIQIGTSHYLGKNFTNVYNVKVQDENNKLITPFTTSWGISTRIIGGLIMIHGDDYGMIMPPKVAPIQVLVSEVFTNKNKKVESFAKDIYNTLLKNNIRVKYLKDSKNRSFDVKKYHIKGVPIIIEIGPNDVENNTITIKKRVNNEKIIDSFDVEKIKKMLINIHDEMFEKASLYLNDAIVQPKNEKEFEKAILEKKIALIPYSQSIELDNKIHQKTKATPRCIKKISNNEKCIFTNELTNELVYFSRSY